MTVFNPKVSIVIPVYNGSNYLREAIESALAQTYSNCEVLVINDGSTDNGATRDIALSYRDRIRYFEKENGGVATALNLGLREMTGEYFSWLSHDDIYYPDKIKAQIEFLAQHENKAVVVYSDYELIDCQSNHLRTVENRGFKPDQFCIALSCTCPLHGCDALVPRGCFEDVGFFDESLRTTNDYNMWYRLAQQYEFHHIAKPLIKGRIHGEQGSVTIRKQQLVEINALNRWMLDNLPQQQVSAYAGNRIARFYLDCAFHYVQIGAITSAWYAIKKSFCNIYKEDIREIAGNHIRLALLGITYIKMSLFFLLHWMKKLSKK